MPTKKSDLKLFLKKQETKRPFWPNLLLLAGSGRNTGKTSFACDIINYLSKAEDIIALKISPHIHLIDDTNPLLLNKRGLIITEEMKLNRKDSSRMKQAGAAHSFYVQAVDGKIPELLQWLKNKWPKGLFICESGGMIDHIKPGLFFFLKIDPIPEERKRFLDLAPVVVNYTDGHSDFDIKKIVIENGAFKLSP